MSSSRVLASLTCAAIAATLLAAGCGNRVATTPDNVATAAQIEHKVSEGRLNAARQLTNAQPVRIDILQLMDGGAMINDPCDPLGLDWAHHDAWVSTINNPDAFLPNWNFEFDWISSKGSENLSGGTDYVVSIRAGRSEPPDEISDLRFTQVEINIRAVNPRSNGHVQGDNYLANQADLPSNANPPEVKNRSLFDLSGGDIAIVVYGLSFRTEPGKVLLDTLAFEHALGPNAWLLFLRDNAYQSGRFYAIEGAYKGAPRAGETTYYSSPPLPPGEALPQPPLGLFQSVQLNGTQFDLLAEPFSSAVDDPGYVCPVDPVSGDGSPTPGKLYAFLNRSNRDENGLQTPAGIGRGGYIFVIRKEAFQGKQVVANPNADPPVAPAPGDLVGPFDSGYNEFLIPPPLINDPPPRHDNAPGGVPNGGPGVHEIGISVLFVHTTAQVGD